MADLLIDIGKVLLDFDFEKSLTTLLPENHPDPQSAMISLIDKKDEFEAGRISVGDYTEWAIKTLASEASIDKFHKAWQDIFTENLPMWESVKMLHRRGHRLIIFSNTNAIHCPWIFEKYPDFSFFEGSVLSFEVDSIKPHPEIYRHAIKKYSLIPEKTLYIDDLAENIAAGEDFGFLTHRYDLNNHPAFEQWLAERLSHVGD